MDGGGSVEIGVIAGMGGAAGTGGRVCPFAFGKAKVDEDTVAGGGVIEEVGGFDVPVEDVVFVDGLKGGEKGSEIVTHLGNRHMAIVYL